MPQRRLPYAMIHVAQTDIEPETQELLREWARRLEISVNTLLKRILIAGVAGQLYAEKIPERDSLVQNRPVVQKARGHEERRSLPHRKRA